MAKMTTYNSSQKRLLPFAVFVLLSLDDVEDSEERPVNGKGGVTSSTMATSQIFSYQNIASLATALSACFLMKRATVTVKVND